MPESKSTGRVKPPKGVIEIVPPPNWSKKKKGWTGASRQQGLIGTEQQEKRPLLRPESESKPFPTESLGPLESVVIDCQQIVEAPLPVCAFSFLAATNLAVQGYADIEIDGRVKPISSYFISIAESGERKSGIDDLALAPHRVHQANLYEDYQEEFLTYSNELDSYNAIRNSILKSANGRSKKKTKEEVDRELNNLGKKPEKPPIPILLVSDPTFESLCQQLHIGLPSLGFFADEGATYLGGFSMKDEQLLRTAGGLSSLWDGKDLDRIRITSDSNFVLSGKRLSLHWMIQTGIAPAIFNKRILQDQGLLSRCLVASGQNVEGRRYKIQNPKRQESYLRYETQILHILKRPLPIAEDSNNKLKPRRIHLSKDAKEVYIKFHDVIQQKMAIGNPFYPIKGVAAKAHDLAARLAATLELYKNIEAIEVSIESIINATDLVFYSLGESLRLFNAPGESKYLQEADKLLQWLTTRKTDAVSLVEIYQKGPSFVRSAEKARKVVSVLYDHGHVVRHEDPIEYNGEIRREVYRLCR